MGKNELYIDPPKSISNDPTEPCFNYINLEGKAKEAEGGETGTPNVLVDFLYLWCSRIQSVLECL